MQKFISYELCKTLAEKWIGQEIETEWTYLKQNWNPYFVENYKGEAKEEIKAFNLEEALEILPKKIDWNRLTIEWVNQWQVWYTDKNNEECYSFDCSEWTTPIEAVEKMIVYLLENNLLLNK